MNFILPLPPTKNQLHSIANNRLYLTKKARDWYSQAGYAILNSPNRLKRPIKGNCYISIAYFLKYKRDIDGGECILDLLEDMKVIDNDSQVVHLNVTKQFDKKEPRVEMEVVKL